MKIKPIKAFAVVHNNTIIINNFSQTIFKNKLNTLTEHPVYIGIGMLNARKELE